MVLRAVLGMLYADDADIVLLSSQGLAKMMAVVVQVSKEFGMTVSDNKTETICIPTRNEESEKLEIKAAGQQHNQTSEFVHFSLRLHHRDAEHHRRG